MKKVFRIILVLHILVINSTWSYAQLFPEKNYPRQYFQWPVGAKVAIAANFGELRPNHFHMGLDCKTDKKQNLPVLAAAEGYIARVKIEPYGFGRCIYINHPNGLTTLYAHLNAFYPALEQYITQQQYELQKWNVFIDIPAGMFRVTKGQFIANSGNTGGSQGPHLHFEIRDTKTDKVLNPLLFGFPLADNIPPNILRLAVYDRCYSTYEQTPKIYSLKKVNGTYIPVGGNIIVNTEKVSFAITAYDRYTGSTNQNGIYEAILFDNNKAVSGFRLDSISYDETRYLNAHIDYKMRSNGGPYLQHLSKLPGYNNGIYTSDGNDGIIHLAQGESHDIKITVSDPNGNSSQVKFAVIQKGYSLGNSNSQHYSQQLFIPGYVNVFENEKVELYFPENALYDSIRFQYREIINAGRSTFQLHNTSVPLQTWFPVKIKGPFFTDTSKVVMKRFSGAKEDYAKAAFANGWYTARFREFGNFQLMEDIIPPTLIPIGFRDGMKVPKTGRIMFSVKDNTEEISNFSALLDGNWLRFSNDKGRTFIYNFDEHCPPGNHELKISVEDQVGNVTERTYRFTR
ncbi:MAG TPA: M23 family metallopeptidase [Ferruginibacter sp.]|nr:M23 family metallopeptidase [Ferruginibacter sp.]